MRRCFEVSTIHLLFVLLVFLLMLYEGLTAEVTCVSSSETRTEKNSSILTLVTSKAIGGIIKVFSYIWKWLPTLLENIIPFPPTLRIINSPDQEDCENEISFNNFD